jgi:hypothetical protein
MRSIQRVIDHGGLVSYKDDISGVQIPYELNINYFDALSNPHSEELLDTQVDRFMIAQAIMLALVGVPGIYFHSLFGSRSWRAGVDLTGRNRTINRQKFDLAAFEPELTGESSLRHQVFPALCPTGFEHAARPPRFIRMAVRMCWIMGKPSLRCCASPRMEASVFCACTTFQTSLNG